MWALLRFSLDHAEPLGRWRFVTPGWGTKFVVDFMQDDEKQVTVAHFRNIYLEPLDN